MRRITLIILCGKYIQDNSLSTQFYKKQPGSVDDVTKTFGVYFRFAVHLQNANAKLHKIV